MPIRSFRASLRTFMIAAAVMVAAGAQETTVILVRHAERASATMGGVDQGLSEAGHKRAEVLARMLGDAKIQAIYTSSAPRTIQTAHPLAKRLSITPQEITEVGALVAALKAHPGQTSLVVHHSNTVPKIIEGLGVQNAPAIAETQFDWMFIVTVSADGDAKLLALHYGEKTMP